jgi:general secretion pathway protein I
LRRQTYRNKGFTLIEVIVSMAILSICLVMVMQTFSGGLKASRTSCDYTRAVVHAKEKMEELSVKPENNSGEFEDGFRWESEFTPYMVVEDAIYNLWKVKVKILWTTAIKRENSVELVSLRTMTNDEDL